LIIIKATRRYYTCTAKLSGHQDISKPSYLLKTNAELSIDISDTGGFNA